ncbi:MAG: hypothetical protein ACI93R_001620 [Flavobacteriales bacterium]|jgi:hypothetical protein
MNNSNPTPDTSQQLALIRGKRKVLEQLIEFSKNLLQQERALEDLLLLSKPSQNIPQKVRNDLVKALEALQNLSDEQLQERVIKVDELVQSGAQGLYSITQNIESFDHSAQDINSKIDQIKEISARFRKRAKLAIALRLKLQERGLVTERLKLSISQDSIAERIAQLKTDESTCRKNISAHIQETISDCDSLLSSKDVPTSLREELTLVKGVMQQNLEHLSAGKSIDSMPVNFEIIDFGDTAPGLPIEPEPLTEPNITQTTTATEKKLREERPKPLKAAKHIAAVATTQSTPTARMLNPPSLIERTKIWLNSPLSAHRPRLC